jgi:hypothetical protein
MSSEMKNCPFCGEQILSVAIKCKHCQTMLKEEIAEKVEPLFTTEKVFYVTSGGSGAGAAGTLTMYKDKLNFIPGGFRLSRGKEIILKYSDVLSMKKLLIAAGVELQTRQGEKIVFRANLWDKDEIQKICDVIRQNE